MKLNKEKQAIIMIIVVVIAMALFAVLVKQNIDSNKMVKQTPRIYQPVQNKEMDNQMEENGEELDSGLDEEEPEIIASDIDTSDWQTYRNEEYGFEFTIPAGLKAINFGTKFKYNLFLVIGNNPESYKGPYTIIVYKFKTFEEFIKDNILSSEAEIEETRIGIGNYKSHKFQVKVFTVDGDTNRLSYFIEHNNYLIQIQFNRNDPAGNENEFNKIINSFKIIK